MSRHRSLNFETPPPCLDRQRAAGPIGARSEAVKGNRSSRPSSAGRLARKGTTFGPGSPTRSALALSPSGPGPELLTQAGALHSQDAGSQAETR